MSCMKRLLIFLVVIFATIPSFAETVKLTSGKVIEGIITDRTDDYIKIDSGVGVQISYYFDEILEINGEAIIHEDNNDLKEEEETDDNFVEIINNGYVRIINVDTTKFDPFTEIDVVRSDEATNILYGNDEKLIQSKIEEIMNNSGSFNPRVFYLMSEILFVQGDKDEAMFWFYAGQLRGRYDANRCADVSAGGAIDQMTMTFGDQINQYAFRDVDKLEKTVSRVIEWDKTTPHNYDHRWINLQGMNAIITALDPKNDAETSQIVATKQEPMSLPESDWKEIHKKTQEQYLADFKGVLNYIKSQ